MVAVQLRPHHLLCLLTYKGTGYSPAFVANYDRVAERIAGGEAVCIVSEPDDICAPLLSDPQAHCRLERVTVRDRHAASDIGRLLNRPIGKGTVLSLTAEVRAKLRSAFASVEDRATCKGCRWREMCSQIARDDYRHTRLSPE